jgi:MscS family membrane protein
MTNWLNSEVFLGVTWMTLGACLLALLLVGVLDRLIHGWLKRRVRRLSHGKDAIPWAALFLDAFSGPVSLFIWVFGIYGALSILLVQVQQSPWVASVQTLSNNAADIVGFIAIIWLAYRLVVVSEVRTKAWAASSQSGIDQLLVEMVNKTLRVIIILIGSIIVIQSLTGIQMGPVIASLGLGGLAVALAAKDSVANFLGTLTIIFDKPFQVGDQIMLDKFEGTVDSVGFRSTRVRTADGHLVSIPNSKVIDSPLQNVGRRASIRWSTTILIAYDTPPAKVRRALEIVMEILRGHEGMKEELPPRVFLTGFKDSSPTITVQAWYHPPIWWDYQAWIQKICMAILEKFDEEDIQLALPAQVVHLPDDTTRQLQLGTIRGEAET